MTADNHNSVNGIRVFAEAKGAKIIYIPLDEDLRVSSLEQFLPNAADSAPNLFAFPAQSNFSGVRHPLEWIEFAHSKGYDVLLDAAAFVPTNKLDLGIVKPDFVPISFYKMFGYPTGVGALIARRAHLRKLARPWFSGGTIQLVTTKYMAHIMAEGVRQFEDETLNYLGIPAVSLGLKFLEKVDIERIHDHVLSLTALALSQLTGLAHSNDQPLCKIYGPKNTDSRGGLIAFNLVSPEGKLIDFRLVEEHALQNNTSLRTGCFCNPGVGEYAF